MALDNAANFAKVTVSTGYNSSATSIVLSSGNGALLPAAPFNLTWWNCTDYPDPSDDPNVEIVRCTAISTDTLTVTRAQEGTLASSKNTSGKTYKMIAGITAKVINTDIPAAIAACPLILATYDSPTETSAVAFGSKIAIYTNNTGAAIHVQASMVCKITAAGSAGTVTLTTDVASGTSDFNNAALSTTTLKGQTGNTYSFWLETNDVVAWYSTFSGVTGSPSYQVHATIINLRG